MKQLRKFDSICGVISMATEATVDLPAILPLNDDDDKTSTRDINAQKPPANYQANQRCLLLQALTVEKTNESSFSSC